MKIIRSTKCTLMFSSIKKRKQLSNIIFEYNKIVNYFIKYFWNNKEIDNKNKLLKPIIDLPNTWLSFSLKQVAARESFDIIKSSIKNKNKTIPICTNKRIYANAKIATLNFSKKSKEFDAWLHLNSIGNKIIFDLPIKFHKHFNKLNKIGKRLNSYIITENYIQFAFEIETKEKKKGNKIIGIDTGINALASLSNKNQYGLDTKSHIERIKRCKHGSKGQKQARRALKQKIDEIAKEIIEKENPDLIVVEKLKNLNHKTKVKRRLTKNIRRSIGSWNYSYWLKRLQSQTELNRVSFRTVSPYYTSQTCHECGYIDRKNRNKELFKCQKCNHLDNADINAALNILDRFITGPYGACYKHLNGE